MRLLWKWRNDPVTRAMSRTAARVGWEAHRAWFRRALENEERTIFLAIHDQQPIGMLRFDRLGDGAAEISISLRADMRGRGLGKQMLIEGCRHGFQALRLRHLYAEVKPDNVASVSCFEAAGFRPIDMTEGMCRFELVRPID